MKYSTYLNLMILAIRRNCFQGGRVGVFPQVVSVALRDGDKRYF